MLPVMHTQNWFPTVFDDFFDNAWMPNLLFIIYYLSFRSLLFEQIIDLV